MPEGSSQSKPWYEILASLTPIILGIGITGVGAFFTQVYNYRQLQLNQLAALDKFRPLLVSENPYEREFAYASFAALGYEDLALKIIAVKRDGAGRAVVQDIQSSGNAAAKVAASAALASLPAQVYIHIGTESQRAKAKELSAALQLAGFQPLGIENVGRRTESPKVSEVRYFNDDDKQFAEAIATVLREQGGGKEVRSRRITFLKARPGSIEVWLANETK